MEAGLQKLGPEIRVVSPVCERRIRGEVRPGTRSPGAVGLVGNDEYVLVGVPATARNENGGGDRQGPTGVLVGRILGRLRPRAESVGQVGWDGVGPGCRIFFGTASDRRLPGQMGGVVINTPRGSLSLKHRRRDRQVRIRGVRGQLPGRTARGTCVRWPSPNRQGSPVWPCRGHRLAISKIDQAAYFGFVHSRM